MTESLKPDNPNEVAEEKKNTGQIAGEVVRIDRKRSFSKRIRRSTSKQKPKPKRNS